MFKGDFRGATSITVDAQSHSISSGASALVYWFAAPPGVAPAPTVVLLAPGGPVSSTTLPVPAGASMFSIDYDLPDGPAAVSITAQGNPGVGTSTGLVTKDGRWTFAL